MEKYYVSAFVILVIFILYFGFKGEVRKRKDCVFAIINGKTVGLSDSKLSIVLQNKKNNLARSLDFDANNYSDIKPFLDAVIENLQKNCSSEEVIDFYKEQSILQRSIGTNYTVDGLNEDDELIKNAQSLQKELLKVFNLLEEAIFTLSHHGKLQYKINVDKLDDLINVLQ